MGAAIGRPHWALADAVRALIPQLEGRALGGIAAGDTGLGTAHHNLVQGTGVMVAVVIGTAGHRAFDTGIGVHGHFLLKEAQ